MEAEKHVKIERGQSVPGEKRKGRMGGLFKNRRLSVHEDKSKMGRSISAKDQKQYETDLKLSNEDLGVDLGSSPQARASPKAADARPRSGRSEISDVDRNSKRSFFGSFKTKKQDDDMKSERSARSPHSLSPPATGRSDHDEITLKLDSALLLHFDQPSRTRPCPLAELHHTNIYHSALQSNQTALEALILAKGDDHPQVIKRRITTASLYKGLGRIHEAVALLEAAVASYRRSREAPAEHVASALNDLALAYSALNRHKEAEALLHETIEILTNFFGGVHPDIAVALGNIALTLRAAREYTSALPYHDRAIKIMESILGKDHPDSYFQRGHYAVTLIRTGETQKGRKILRDVVANLQTLNYPSSHPWVAVFVRDMGSKGNS